MSNKNVGSSDAVKCSNLQIWSLNHKVFQTPIYLSHLMILDACYADITIPEIRDIGLQIYVQGDVFSLYFRTL